MNNKTRREVLGRIEKALNAASYSIAPFLVKVPKAEFKFGTDPVTAVDRVANHVLRHALLQDGEGWLSEETFDDLDRLSKERLWIVDPIDGTRELISGIPEWCISVAFADKGRVVAGGICNPLNGELFLGALGEGVTLNGTRVDISRRTHLTGAMVLASRSEVARGEWNYCREARFVTHPMGSIAYKMALVAAGKADATWTRCPKHEWDVAAGSALVEAAGGIVRDLNGSELRFNNPSPLLSGLVACGPGLEYEVSDWLNERTGILRTEPKRSSSQTSTRF